MEKTLVNELSVLRLVAYTLAASVFALILDAAFGQAFQVPAPFWGIPVAILGFLTAALNYRRNGNGKS
jgi:hypothetical protein